MDTAYNNASMRDTLYSKLAGYCSSTLWMGTWKLKNKDLDYSIVGKTIILPSSHTGGPRYRAQNYQDAMSICRWAGYPDLFLTFTCNPKWTKINAMTRLINQDPDGCRVDFICRVFQIKLLQLMRILKKDKPFGTIIVHIDSDGFPIYMRRNTDTYRPQKLAEGSIHLIYITGNRLLSAYHFIYREWFEANKEYPDARELTYSDFPMCWIWNGRDKQCTRGKMDTQLAEFTLHIQEVENACYALGLLDDDKEWNDCLSEVAQWASGNELRHLFVTILMNCQLHTKQIEAYTLFKIESILLKMGRSLKDIEGMPLSDSALMRNVGNRLINEELDYDKDELQILHDQSLAMLNTCQHPAYEEIIASVHKKEGKLFFIHGHGGRDKTFLWNTIISKIRSQSKIVLPIATSGIAALLLPNGRTTLSRFHIPLEIMLESTCEIKQGSQLAELLKKTALIIWDEAPMANKLCFEALDRTLRDILRDRYENSDMKPFGGITFVCGGDFRQILPVIPKGTRGDIMDALLNNSQLWPYFSIYELTENMRLSCGKVRGSEARKLASFDKWLL
ncbi:hypothetical protein KY289_010987 [Solanum tuberosum]|nr:hypothetical protein KY289_010987 [Solanum tuberosum]